MSNVPIKSTRFAGRFLATLSVLGTLVLVAGCGSDSSGGGEGEVIPLKEAKLLIEHNDTVGDTGFQGFIDSDGWSSLTVTGPNGPVLSFKGLGSLGGLGLTELFFETVEPENAEVPIETMLSKLPAGEYTIAGPSTEEGFDTTTGTATLTHTIPNGAVLTAPLGPAVVTSVDVTFSWNAVTDTIDGTPLANLGTSIVAYELIVEKDEEPHPHAFNS